MINIMIDIRHISLVYSDIQVNPVYITCAFVRLYLLLRTCQESITNCAPRRRVAQMSLRASPA